MHERKDTQRAGEAGTQQLKFLEHSIMNGIRWQEAWKLADEQKRMAAKPLRIHLSDLQRLSLSLNRSKVR